MDDGTKLIPGVTVPGDGCEEFECHIVNKVPIIKKLTTLCLPKYSGCKDNLNRKRSKHQIMEEKSRIEKEYYKTWKNNQIKDGRNLQK